MKSKLSACKLFRAGMLAFVLVIMACASAAFAEGITAGMDFSLSSQYISPSSITIYCNDGHEHGTANVTPIRPGIYQGDGKWLLTIDPADWAYYVEKYNEAGLEKDPDFIPHSVDGENAPNDSIKVLYTHECTEGYRNVQITLTKAVSCTEDGNYHYKCLECLREWDMAIPAGHPKAMREKTGSQEPTCVKSGWNEYTCTLCGATGLKEEIKSSDYYYYHNYVQNDELSYPATCTKSGKTVKVCEYCGKQDVTWPAALNHPGKTYKPEKSTKATCTTDGANYYDCPRCEQEVMVPVKATGHSYPSHKMHHHSPGDTTPYEVYCRNCEQYVPYSELSPYYQTVATRYYPCPACKDSTCTDPEYVTNPPAPVDPETDEGEVENQDVKDDGETQAEPVDSGENLDSAPAPKASDETAVALAVRNVIARVGGTDDAQHIGAAPAAEAGSADEPIEYTVFMHQDSWESDKPGYQKSYPDIGDHYLKENVGKSYTTSGYAAHWDGGGEMKLPAIACTYKIQWINASNDEVIKELGFADHLENEIATVKEEHKNLPGWKYLPGHAGELLSGTVTKDGALVLKLYFEKTDENPTYIVKWVTENPEGGEPIVLRTSDPRQDVKAGDTASVTDEDKALTLEHEGNTYTFDAGNGKNVLTKVVAKDGSTVLVLYMKKADDATPVYTVRWMADGKDLCEPEKRYDVKAGEEASVTDVDKERAFSGYTFNANAQQDWTRVVAEDGSTELILYYGKSNTPGGTPEIPPVIPENPPVNPPAPGEDIPEPDVPLSDIPSEDPPLTDIPEEDPPLEDIPEEDPPLSGVPETGDISQLWTMLALLTGAGLVWMVLDSKKHRKDA